MTPLAEAVADRYFEEFPGDIDRYGDAAREWEVHDTLHCLNWALLDVKGYTSLEKQALWLAGILRARDFPVEQLARNLELAADVMRRPGGGREAARRGGLAYAEDEADRGGPGPLELARVAETGGGER